MKKTAILICALLTAVMLFSSCSLLTKEYTTASMFDATNPPEIASSLTGKSTVSALSGFVPFSAPYDYYNSRTSYNELLFFKNSDGDVKIYNVDKNEVILTIDYKEFVSLDCFDCFGVSFAMVVTKERNKDNSYEYTTTLYSSNGDKVASADGQYDSDDKKTGFDLFQFNSKIYRTDRDGKCTEVCDTIVNGNLSFDAKTVKTDKYYYAIGSSSVTVYDLSLNKLFFWQCPYDTYDCSINPLNGGKFLIQYILLLPDDAAKYDIIYEEDDSAKKAELVSIILDSATGKEKKVSLDYAVYYTATADQILEEDPGDNLPDGVETVAYIMPIENKRIVVDQSKFQFVAMDANGKVAGKLYSDLEGNVGMPSVIANNRAVYKNASGDRFLIDFDGRVISKFNGFSSVSYDNMVQSYFVLNDKIYDYNLKEVLDLKSKGYTITNTLLDGYMLKDAEGECYIFADGSEKSIEKANTRLNEFLYTTYDSIECTYTLYNDQGKSIMTGDRNDYFELVGYWSEGSLIRVYDYSSSEYIYYYIK